MNNVLETIKNRRSIRNYKAEQISQEELDQIIEAGIYAPTAGNEQPWHFTIVQNPDALKHINEVVKEEMIDSDIEWVRNAAKSPTFNVTYDAPTLIIVSGRADGMAWQADCSAAIENMMLAAESLNIGSVWIGLIRNLFKRNEEVEKLEIPEGFLPYYGVSFGYKANEKRAEAPKRNRDVVNYIR